MLSDYQSLMLRIKELEEIITELEKENAEQAKLITEQAKLFEELKRNLLNIRIRIAYPFLGTKVQKEVEA